MPFTPDDYQRFAFGVDHAAFDDAGAWLPQRIGAAMTPIYSDQEGKVIRRNCTAGIGLRFASDARAIRLAWRTSHPARARFRGSLVVDGGAPMPIGSTDGQGAWSGVIDAGGNGAMRTIELHLPHTCRAEIASIELDNGARMAPAPPLGKRWLVYGDSITQGMDATLPTDTVINRCARALGLHARNLGVGGAINNPLLAETVPDFPFDLVSIAYGTNDYNLDVPAADFAARTRRLVAALAKRNPAAPIILITPLTWIDGETQPNKIGQTLADLRRAIAPIADEFAGVRLVEGTDLMPHDAALFADKVHPNDAGFAVYADNLLPHLRAAL